MIIKFLAIRLDCGFHSFETSSLLLSGNETKLINAFLHDKDTFAYFRVSQDANYQHSFNCSKSVRKDKTFTML